MSKHPKPHIIGVAGGTCSGKTLFVRTLTHQIGRSRITSIEYDSYYRDITDIARNRRYNLNYDHPDPLDTDLLTYHLNCLPRGLSVEIPAYDFASHTRKKDTILVNPNQFIVVEGFLIYSVSDLRDIFDSRIYIHAPPDIRLARRLKRDVAERGRGRTVNSVLRQYLSTVRPTHNKFVRPTHAFAHLLISGAESHTSAINRVKTILQSWRPPSNE